VAACCPTTALKARKGRGRKQVLWTSSLRSVLVSEFDRLSHAGLKFNGSILLSLAKDLLKKKVEFGVEPGLREPEEIIPLITKRLVQTFMERHQIVSRRQCGKLLVSPVEQVLIERSVAYHLSVVSRAFADGTLDEDLLENRDETHFVVNVDNGRTLSFIGCDKVRYADVSSGGEGMTMVVRVTWGRNASIEAPFIVFKNQKRNYPIRGVPDDVPGVSYRTGPRGWMDREVFVQWLHEPRAIKKDTYGRERIIFLDNCSGHNATDAQKEALKAINAVLKFLPPNSTHLCQPCDSVIIQKIKERWRALWEEKKVEMMSSTEWVHGTSQSGKLSNPGKRFFLKIAAKAVKDVSDMRDKNGVSYARKAMMRYGLSLDLNGQWQIFPLFPHLQRIIVNHKDFFDGKAVNSIDSRPVGNGEE